jgi:large subunit ribosomal protein L25
VLHVDFQRVDKDHKIHVKVPLHFLNAEVAPGVKLGGGKPHHIVNELDVECLPGSLPEFIEVDMGQLEVGHSIHANDLVLPKGVELVAHVKQENPAVASISAPKGGAAEETPAAPAA